LLDSDAWRVESLQVKLRNEVADQLGAPRGMFHAGILEMPTRMVQSVGDAVVLSVAAHELQQVLPRGGDDRHRPNIVMLIPVLAKSEDHYLFVSVRATAEVMTT
jgi:hypothetical protein